MSAVNLTSWLAAVMPLVEVQDGVRCRVSKARDRVALEVDIAPPHFGLETWWRAAAAHLDLDQPWSLQLWQLSQSNEESQRFQPGCVEAELARCDPSGSWAVWTADDAEARRTRRRRAPHRVPQDEQPSEIEVFIRARCTWYGQC